jgi:hypothetical protein
MSSELCPVIYVALELSRSKWLVALLRPGDQRPSRYSIEAGGRDRLLRLLARERTAIERRLGVPVRVCCCYEAGYEGFWLHRNAFMTDIYPIPIQISTIYTLFVRFGCGGFPDARRRLG